MMAYPFKRSRNLPRAKSVGPRKKVVGMNKGEAAYAALLDTMLDRGVIVGWWYELLSIRLADNTRYNPDFVVMLADGTLEFHEVKARKNGKDGKPDSYWAEEDAKLKVKLVAEHSPIPVIIVWPNRNGGWVQVRF